MRYEADKNTVLSGRRWVVLFLYTAMMICLLGRAVELQVLNRDVLRDRGDARAVREVSIPAHRGMIVDRNGEALAISTPMNSIWAEPKKLLEAGNEHLDKLAKHLQRDATALRTLLRNRMDKQFVYLKRQVVPTLAERIEQLEIPGVSLEKEYRRYYPAGEVTAHVLGFTNIDDRGQEGLELAYDDALQGTPGGKRVLKDRLGRTIQNIESIRTSRPGNSIELSIDKRVQYLSYRELKAAVKRHRARAGVLVMLDATTGEVIAMVGQPAYNPNNKSRLKGAHYRNRALTDVFEPGSTLKPFTIATALSSGMYTPGALVDTRPGSWVVGEHTIQDHQNYGVVDLSTIIKKSSNVGASRIALSLESVELWSLLSDVGFGQMTASGFPGEAAGYLGAHDNWSEVEQATIAFGYGISVTALQLAQAYLAFASDGMILPISFLKHDGAAVAGYRVLSADVAGEVRRMLEGVVGEGGTGRRAAISGYRVAGKTGTVHKSTAGGYAEDRYLSLFVGMAPASNPRLVTVVVIDEPGNGEYFGGLVAAPVFSEVMAGALRLLDIPPDDIPVLGEQIAVTGAITP